MGFCDHKKKEIDQYGVPKAINIHHKKSDSNMQFELTMKSPSHMGLCKGLTTIATGVTAGIDGAAAGILTVVGMFCDA